MLKTAAALVLLCVVAVILFFPVLFHGRILLPGDYLAHFSPWKSERPPALQWNPLMWDAIAQFYPWRLYVHKWVARGVIPLWNPHQFCGAPFLANLQSAVFYPPNLIFVFFDPARALGFSVALHLLLAAIGIFCLSRGLGVSVAGAVLSGVCFGFCTFLVSWAELPTVICTIAWLPWIILTVDRLFDRPSPIRAAALAVLLALCVLGGHLQMAFYCALTTALWTVRCAFLHRRDRSHLAWGLALAICATIVALLLVSAQMIPTAELASLSARGGERTAEAFAGKMMTLLQPSKLVVAFSPKFFGSPSDGNYLGDWNYAEHAMYVGIVGLFLALVGAVSSRSLLRSRWFFIVLAGVAMALAAGRTANAVLYFHLPGYAGFGSPARILVLWCFAVSLLAGMGLDCILSRHYLPKRQLTAMAACALAFAVVWAGCDHIARAVLSPCCLEGLGAWRNQAVILSLAAAVLALTIIRGLSRQVGTSLILVLAVADLLAANWHYNPTCRRDQAYSPTPTTNILLAKTGFERILPLNGEWSLYGFPRAILPPNSAMVYGLNDAQGYDSLFPGAYKAWLRETLGRDPSPVENGNMVFIKELGPAVLGLGRFVVSRKPVDAPDLRRIAANPYVYENPSVSRASVSVGSVELNQIDPNELRIRSHCPIPSLLTVRDAYYPGWRAYIDGRKASFSDVGPTHMFCKIPAGEHEVRLRYKPSSFRVGLHLSLVGLSILAGMLGYGLASRRRR